MELLDADWLSEGALRLSWRTDLVHLESSNWKVLDAEVGPDPPRPGVR
jgi:hypothetical protein